MIILTGASGGIGKELLSHLIEIDEVLGIYNTKKPISISSSTLSYQRVDLEETAQIASFIEHYRNKLSRVTLIHAAAKKIDNLAGVYCEADWDHVMGVNMKGNFLLTQALLPFMISERWGRIIHISSLGAIQGRPGTIAYSASKAGIHGMSRVLAKEYARFNITSNVLLLGYFDVGMFLALSNDEKQRIIDRIPSKELGDISNIANAIKFLIESGYVNGATINIDGGAD